MKITDILVREASVLVLVSTAKNDLLAELAGALASAEPRLDAENLLRVLREREALQSTGIGAGVAIPHTSLPEAPGQAAALLICPHGVPFDSIDGKDVTIILGVVGPKAATGEHLRVLATSSRLLRDPTTRAEIVASPSPEAAYDLIVSREQS